MARCYFCRGVIKPGTGKLYITKDAKQYNYCSSKCEKNHLILKRIPRKQKWVTKKH